MHLSAPTYTAAGPSSNDREAGAETEGPVGSARQEVYTVDGYFRFQGSNLNLFDPTGPNSDANIYYFVPQNALNSQTYLNISITSGGPVEFASQFYGPVAGSGATGYLSVNFEGSQVILTRQIAAPFSNAVTPAQLTFFSEFFKRFTDVGPVGAGSTGRSAADAEASAKHQHQKEETTTTAVIKAEAPLPSGAVTATLDRTIGKLTLDVNSQLWWEPPCGTGSSLCAAQIGAFQLLVRMMLREGRVSNHSWQLALSTRAHNPSRLSPRLVFTFCLCLCVRPAVRSNCACWY